MAGKLSFENKLYSNPEIADEADVEMKSIDNNTVNHEDENYSQENPIYWQQESNMSQSKFTTTISKYYRWLLLTSLIISTIALILILFVVTGVIKVHADNKTMDIQKQQATVSKLTSHLEAQLKKLEPTLAKLDNLTSSLNDHIKKADIHHINLYILTNRVKYLNDNVMAKNTNTTEALSAKADNITHLLNQHIKLFEMYKTNLYILEQRVKYLSDEHIDQNTNKSISLYNELSNLKVSIAQNNKKSENLTEVVNQQTDNINYLRYNSSTQKNATYQLNKQIIMLYSVTTKQTIDTIELDKKVVLMKENLSEQINSTNTNKKKIEDINNQFTSHVHLADWLFSKEGWERINGSTFYFPKEKLSWAVANTFCQKLNMNLTSIHSEEENKYIANNLKKRNIIWAYTGLHDTITERNFTWTDGTASNFFNWHTGEPNNSGDEDCATVYATGYWYDFGCATVGNFICNFLS